MSSSPRDGVGGGAAADAAEALLARFPADLTSSTSASVQRTGLTTGAFFVFFFATARRFAGGARSMTVVCRLFAFVAASTVRAR